MIGRYRFSGDKQHCAEAIGKVRITGEIPARCLFRRGAYSRHIAHCRQISRGNHILNQVVARFVDIGIDFVRHQYRRRPSEPHTDIPADLADPNRLSFICIWALP